MKGQLKTIIIGILSNVETIEMSGSNAYIFHEKGMVINQVLDTDLRCPTNETRRDSFPTFPFRPFYISPSIPFYVRW